MPSRNFITRETSVPGFKALKDRLTVSLGANTAGDFKLKLVLMYDPKNHNALNNYAKSTLPVLLKWNNKAWMTTHLFTTCCTEYFNPIVENYCSGKKRFLSKCYCLLIHTWSLKNSNEYVQCS